jgi:hypothetical protein
LLALLLAAPGVLSAEVAAEPHPAVAALGAAGIWRPLEPPRTFDTGNLYEEIDGEAELFLPYGMRRLTVATVVRTGDPAGEVRLELFRMDSPRDAYGIWSQHRYPDQEILRLPSSEAVVSDTTADFFRGDTFVRLRAKPGDRSRRDVTDLAAAVAALLAGSGAAPEEARVLERLPGTLAGSVIYQKKAMLGYECLAPGFEARSSTRSGGVRLLLIPGGVDRLQRMNRELPGFREFSASTYRADLPSGPLWFTRSGSCLVGLAGERTQEEDAPLLAAAAEAAADACGPPRER